jgi:6-phosphogluconolactonase (cycloisomerase 2 family)
MTFKKFGKVLVMVTLSAGIVLGVTSCIQSYSVGYLYVTGTVTAQSNGAGIITGYKINHNTGQLTQINGLPVSSGGANPVRAVLVSSSRFMYVLNRGTTASGGSDCTTTDPCIGANVTQFAVGGNGVLTPQETFYTQGVNPFRLVADQSGSFLYVLDHDSPNSPSNPNCAAELGKDSNGNPITACGDITAFSINQTTGRLSVIVNIQASTNLGTGAELSYFPVPVNPVDFAITTSNLFVLNGTASGAALANGTIPTQYPYSGGTTVFPYAFAPNGQLTITANSSQGFGNFAAGTAIQYSGGFIYLLDDEPPSPNASNASSQILPFSAGIGGVLNPVTGGAIADDPSLTNPIQLMTEAKNKWVYVANFGSNNTAQTGSESGIAGFVIDQTTHQLSFIAGEPFGSGSGPECIVEDPSDQFIFTANFNDSSVTGRLIDQNAGVLDDLRGPSTYTLTGQPTWCLVDGRTD